MSDIRIERKWPTTGGHSQGTTWYILERDDGHYVVSHWAAMWKGGSNSYGCHPTDAAAEKWIRNFCKQRTEKRYQNEKNQKLREIKKLQREIKDDAEYHKEEEIEKKPKRKRKKVSQDPYRP